MIQATLHMYCDHCGDAAPTQPGIDLEFAEEYAEEWRDGLRVDHGWRSVGLEDDVCPGCVKEVHR